MAEKYILDINSLGNMNGFEPFYEEIEEEELENSESIEVDNKEEVVEDDSLIGIEGSVVDDENQEIVDDREPSEEGGNSPDFYNSIAASLNSDGVLQLSEEDLKNIKSAEDLSSAFKKHIESQLSETNKRVLEALDLGVPKEELSQVEKTLSWLAGVTDDIISAETDEANVIRQNLIYQDLLNSGVSEDKARKLVKHALDEGTDIEEALKALENNKKYYLGKRNEIVEKKKQEIEANKEADIKRQEKIKTLFLEKEEPVKGIKLTKTQRENLYNQATKVVGKNKNGKFVTALEKYAENNPEEYQYNLNVLYYLTNGFKDLTTVISKEVSAQTKSKLRDLEKALKTPSGQSSLDNIKFGNDTDPDAIDDGFSIDLK